MRYEWDRRGVVRRDGHEVATIRRSRWRSRGDALIGPYVWELRTKRHETVATRIPPGGRILRGHPRSAFTRSWEATDGVHQFELRPTGWLSCRLDVVRDGVRIGDLGPARRAGVYRPALRTDVDLPLEEVLFLMWLGHLAANRSHGGG